jgi:hypothetical protein
MMSPHSREVGAPRRRSQPNLRMQPTGRSGPEPRAGATLLEAIQWKPRFVRAEG